MSLALAAVTPACEQVQKAMGGSKASVKLGNDDQKTLYALGLVIGSNLKPFALSKNELDIVQQGIADSIGNAKPKVTLEQYGPKIGALAQGRAAKAAEIEGKKSKEFLSKAEKEAGSQKTASGLIFKTIKPGSGASPQASDTVKVHYHGTLTDGTVFDSSVSRGAPVEFPLGSVIPCWTEGVQKMKVGEKAKLICPADIAYGAQGRPPKIPGGATLVFEVELIEIKGAAAAASAAAVSSEPAKASAAK
jgi:FKBP-type peptidyl-prolyl cis-trans isomerase FkpA